MGLSEAYNTIKEAKKSRHQEWKTKNLKSLVDEGIEFSTPDESVALLREPNKPKVDFYLTTGRWKVVTNKKINTGGAEKFLEWYKEQ